MINEKRYEEMHMGEKIMDGFPSREEALADFFAAWEPARSVEYVALDDAVGRVLACDPGVDEHAARWCAPRRSTVSR